MHAFAIGRCYTVYMNCHCAGSSTLAKFQHGVAIICVILYILTIPNSAQTSFFVIAGIWGPAVQPLRASQTHSSIARRLPESTFFWASVFRLTCQIAVCKWVLHTLKGMVERWLEKSFSDNSSRYIFKKDTGLQGELHIA
jgi:hypothetical protein